ncbi:MAG TPA: hypothetical protein VIQ76_15945 [Propionibacteriaceae bacterium]
MLLYVADHQMKLDQPVKLVFDNDYPVAYAHDGAELRAVVRLAMELKRLRLIQNGFPEPPFNVALTFALNLTPDGWERVQALRENLPRHRQAFVAMWFDPSMDIVFNEGFEPAFGRHGYKALRIDRAEHNEKIDDRIIAEIRASGVLAADFTGNRAGVYFEAGYAKGLGIPVIWTCRKDCIKRVHFDTRQYNHIVWQEPADLAEKLENRIRATLPTYPALS